MNKLFVAAAFLAFASSALAQGTAPVKSATAADGLNTATGTVVVKGATAPTTGQVLTATGANAANWQTPSAGGGSLAVTDGTTNVTGTATLTVDAKTLKVGGSAGAATLTPIVTTTAHAGSFSTWNLGGQDELQASGSVTLPTLAAGQTFLLVTDSGATATLTVPGGVTLAGVASQSTVAPLSFLACSYVSPTSYSCFSGASAAAGSTTIASGTAALGTSAIASGACATAVTATATGTATTDVLGWGFNGDPTAVTGYVPATTGMLTIIGYPTSNTANFKVCNNTSSSVTPGAVTLNWRVVR